MNYKKKRKMGEKGVITLSLIFIVLFVVLVLIFGIMIPALQLFNAKIWASSDNLLDQKLETAANIKNDEMRATFETTTQGQIEAVQTNEEFLGFLNQYSWFIVTAIIVIVLFLHSRQIVETQSQTV